MSDGLLEIVERIGDAVNLDFAFFAFDMGEAQVRVRDHALDVLVDSSVDQDFVRAVLSPAFEAGGMSEVRTGLAELMEKMDPKNGELEWRDYFS